MYLFDFEFPYGFETNPGYGVHMKVTLHYIALLWFIFFLLVMLSGQPVKITSFIVIMHYSKACS